MAWGVTLTLKRLTAIILVMAGIFVLPACGGKELENTANNIQEFYQGVESCSIKAEVTANYTDSVAEYELMYERQDENKGTVTVLSPSEISGLRAIWDGEESKLSYEDVILETGKENEADISPVKALPLLLKSWAGGYVTSMGSEKRGGAECYVLSYDSQKGETKIEYRTWFEKGSYHPVSSEIYLNGRLFISCEFELCTF